ncbi:DNA gyrase subunit A [Patescibacteria group bacterium]|nr:DNA gyrase subunit A [Patescibacteria group bacterium]
MAEENNIDVDHIGKIKPRILEQEMQESYLDYAMSVIISRALPDARDGLKPVHRRVLFAMNETGLRHSAKFRKSAYVVGEVLGKYHPHGDMAVYDTIVRLAQDFSMRYPLVQGQGNFGSVDGDSAAAPRYTEARMSAIAEELLTDIDKNTVDFMDNYDGTRKEPKVLPTKVPQLLLNGTMGIAVGMATSIPPHNLRELMGAIALLIDNPEASIDELINIVPAPDFPTGGVVYNPEEIKEAYVTGKGRVVMRAVAEIEDSKKGFRIIISEIPYQVNKSELVSRIAELVKTKKIIGISDLRDESDKDGIRVVVELKSDSYPKKVLNQLYKMTAMQSTFHINLLALVDGGLQPKVLNLKQCLEIFIAHRQEVVTRRTQFELNKAEERAHILEGLKIALDNLDAVISTIRKSNTKEEAHTNLVKKFKLSDVQATAILEMRLQALAGLERKKVEDEYKEKKNLIKELKDILADTKKILEIVKKESQEINDKFGDDRRTKIVNQTLGKFSEKDLVPNEEVIITMSKGGYIKRQPVVMYRSQIRGGKGIIGMTTKEEDQIENIQSSKNHDDVLFFTNRGRVFRQKVYEIPQSSRIAKGTAIVNVIQLAPEEIVTALLTMPSYKAGDNFVMVTRRGVIKKTAAEKYANIRTNGLIAIKLDQGDELKWVRKSGKGDSVVIMTKEGQSIHFAESDARMLGRSTRGVRGIKLRQNDEVISADIASPSIDYVCLVISEKGFGKRTNLNQYSLQHRGGIGVKTMNLTVKTGKLIGGELIEKSSNVDIIITSVHGQVIRTPLNKISLLGRVTQGVTVMRLKSSDKVASFSIINKEVEEEVLQPDKPEKSEKSNSGTKPKTPADNKKPTSFTTKTMAPSPAKPEKIFAKRKIIVTGVKERASKLAQKRKGFIKKKISQSLRNDKGSRLSKKRKK